MKPAPVKIHVVVEQGGIQIAEMVTEVSGGRHEFTLGQPLLANGRTLTGWALEMHLDQETRRVAYNEHVAKRPLLYVGR